MAICLLTVNIHRGVMSHNSQFPPPAPDNIGVIESWQHVQILTGGSSPRYEHREHSHHTEETDKVKLSILIFMETDFGSDYLFVLEILTVSAICQ